MEDYVIRRAGGGEFVISAQTQRAQNRTPGGIARGYMLAFKSRSELMEYARASPSKGKMCSLRRNERHTGKEGISHCLITRGWRIHRLLFMPHAVAPAGPFGPLLSLDSGSQFLEHSRRARGSLFTFPRCPVEIHCISERS